MDGKKYKSGTGNWKIFSWREPTEGQGAFTCGGSSSKSTSTRYENVVSISTGNGVLCVLYISTSKCQHLACLGLFPCVFWIRLVNTGLPESVPVCVLDKANIQFNIFIQSYKPTQTNPVIRCVQKTP